MYRDLEDRFGKWLVSCVVRKLRFETGREPAYIEILMKLEGSEDGSK